MTCHEAQSNLSLYLYGELEFAVEEALECHLEECAFCQLALGREKAWHAGLNDGQPSVPFELLADCRTKLQSRITAAPPKLPNEVWRERLRRQLALFYQACYTWPARVAVAGLLLLTGFGAGRWADRRQMAAPNFAASQSAGMFPDDPYTRVRGIQPVADGRVRIVIDRIQQGELTGPVTDGRIRGLLFIASRDAANPAIRVDSVQVLTGQTGPDVQKALLASLQQDPNAAVRMKALDALRPFAGDGNTRTALIHVLQHDADPGLRSEAIDVLLSGVRRVNETPDVLRALQQMAQPEEQDDYIRARSIQFLRMADGRVVEAY
jgi:hypothetical protein